MAIDTADLVIVGAGGAGLSLASRLAAAGRGNAGRVVVYDARTAFPRDRTWCYWNVTPHPFTAAVTHRWHAWQITASDGSVVRCGSERYAYEHIPADAFYAEALARIGRASHVELRLGERVLALEDSGSAVRVMTTRGELQTTRVFDSRLEIAPSVASSGFQPRAPALPRLVQTFAGVIITTAAPVFDPARAILMDFSAEWEGEGLGFGYVLPYSSQCALVELAVIAPEAPPRVTLEAALSRYVARTVGNVPHEKVGREAGLIPMDAAHVERHPSPRVTRIGLAGGMAKPSTGYAFLAMQRDADQLAASVQADALQHEFAGGHRASAPRGVIARGLDHIFLRRLATDWSGAPALFARMFARAEPDALVRFLSDVATPGDVARVVAALPPLPFVAEAYEMLRSATATRILSRPGARATWAQALNGHERAKRVHHSASG